MEKTLKTLADFQSALPKDELIDGAYAIFKNTDEKAVTKHLTDPSIAEAAFRAVFFDIEEAQVAKLSF